MTGNYFEFEEFVTSAKMNEQTDNISAGVAQGAYQTLQANDVFENKDFLAADEYTDATGTNNTVNTGSSTANFSTDHYELSIASTNETTDSTSFVSATTFAITTKFGVRFTSKIDGTFTKVTKTSTCTATTAYLYDSTPTLLETASFSGNDATFNSSISNGSSYWVYVDSGGASYTVDDDTARTYPISGTNVNFIGGARPSFTNDTDEVFNVASVGTSTGVTYDSSGTVVCDTGTLTLDGTEKAICVYSDHTLPTGNGPDGTDDTTSTSLTESSNSSVTDKRGLKINPNEDLYIQSVTKESTCDATTAYVTSTAGTVLSTATFSTDTATFALEDQTKLTSATDYYLVLDKGGSSYTQVTDSTVTFPLSGTYLDITAGVNTGTTETASEYYNITSIVSQTNSASSSDATTVTVDISDGTTTLSSQTFTDKSTGVLDITSLTAASTLELTFNLTTLDTAVTPEQKGWGVLVFK